MKALTKSVGRATAGRKMFTDWSGGGWTPLGGYGGQGSPHKVAQAINTYGGTDESSSAVFACVTKIATDLAGYEFALVGPDGKTELQRNTETEGLFALMAEPAPDVTYFDWVADVETDLCLVGNSFYLMDNQNALGQPEALERLMPQSVAIATDEAGRKIGYVVQVRGRQIPFTVDQVLHYRLRNPFNKHLGMGIVEAIMREVEIDLDETEHIGSFFANGAKIAGVLMLPADVDEPTFQRLKREVTSEYGGPGNAYKTLLAAGATDFKATSSPPADTGVVELRRMSLDAIYKGFTMPEFLLGGIAQGGVYKMSEAQYIYFGGQKPRARRFEERTTITLTSRWKGAKFKSLPAMAETPEDKLINAERIPHVGGSLNETRVAAGLSPIKDGNADVPMIQQGLVPFGTVVAGEGQGLRQIIDEPVIVPRTGEGEKNPPAQIPEKTVRLTEIAQPRLPHGFEQRGNAVPLHSEPDAMQAIMNGQADLFHTATPSLANDFRSFFAAQQSRVLRALHDQGQKQVDVDGRKNRHAAFKSLSVSDVFDMAKENELLQGIFSKALDSLGELALQGPKAALGKLGAGISWSQTSPHIWAARKELATQVKRINEVTQGKLAKTIAVGIERGYSVPQIATGTDEGYGGITGTFLEADDARAETIARTESAFLYNAAAAAANDEAEIDDVEILDGDDADTDAPCKEANRQKWSNAKFKEHPIQHPNCVRVGVPVVPTTDSREVAGEQKGLPPTGNDYRDFLLMKAAGFDGVPEDVKPLDPDPVA